MCKRFTGFVVAFLPWNFARLAEFVMTKPHKILHFDDTSPKYRSGSTHLTLANWTKLLTRQTRQVCGHYGDCVWNRPQILCYSHKCFDWWCCCLFHLEAFASATKKSERRRVRNTKITEWVFAVSLREPWWSSVAKWWTHKWLRLSQEMCGSVHNALQKSVKRCKCWIGAPWHMKYIIRCKCFGKQENIYIPVDLKKSVLEKVIIQRQSPNRQLKMSNVQMRFCFPVWTNFICRVIRLAFQQTACGSKILALESLDSWGPTAREVLWDILCFCPVLPSLSVFCLCL